MDKVIHITCQLPCDSVAAFQDFTENQALQSWLCPQAHVVAEPGGAYELFWEPENPEINSTKGCKITAMQPHQMLAFEWRSPAQFKDFANQADPLTHVTVAFIPTDTGTDIHLVHSGWRSTPDWEEARQWQQRAWDMAFVALKKKWATPQA